MFDNLKNVASMMGQAKQMKEKFEQLQAELSKKTVEGESGAGAVRAVVNGKFDVLSIRMDRPLLQSLAGSGPESELEMIEELITAAVNAAMAKVRELVQQEVSKLTGGLNIPGLSGMLGGQ